jgi:hypothetical protein
MNRRLITALLVLLTMLSASACGGGDPRCADLPGGGRYCLQATSALPPFDVQQKVDAVFGTRRETMIVELEVDPQGMRFAGLTPFGQKMIQATYDNSTVAVHLWPDSRLDPVLMLALLQLAWWPPESVRNGLDASLAFEQQPGLRRFLRDGNLVLEVGYTGEHFPPSAMHILVPAATLELDITTLESPTAK